ncbi:uncharacterized protein LOC128985568 [Macrosteles quadrilineatus]|uniref:uncharacterized protein LOC128985568 n=1 Tax=Macrosteles quadrilineatus TaxID=74068 RepID=UPI0023E296D0|nr:uncharacterized protein LOC128985568 [Macrosteles quadrilineatus]
MTLLWRTVWLVSMYFWTSRTDMNTLPKKQEAIHFPKSRALAIDDKQDIGSYFPVTYQQQYPSGPYPPPPPTYGPPPPTPPIPNGMVRIEFAFDEIVLRCITEEPFEHIVWTKHQCPQQLLFGAEGVHIADGSTVHQEDLYDVHIRAHDGTVISELLIKHPITDNSDGIYQCEVWPHIHSGGGYYPFNPYQNYNPPKSEVFIIGGNSLLEECYRVSNFGSSANNRPTNRPNNSVGSKQNSNNEKPKFKDNLFSLKPRRNTTENKKDSNSKQLRYNLTYVNNSLYNVEGANVTADFFRPSKNIPDNLIDLHRNTSAFPTRLKDSYTSYDPDNYFGRNNDKYREIFSNFDARQGKDVSVFSNTSSRDTLKKVL